MEEGKFEKLFDGLEKLGDIGSLEKEKRSWVIDFDKFMKMRKQRSMLFY